LFVLLTWADEQLGVVRSPQVTAWIVLFFAAVALGVGCEAVCGERVGHRVECRLERTVLVGARRHACRHTPAVVDADVLGQLLGPGGPEGRQRPAEQLDEHVVVA